jgi:hypothetical protein
VLQSVSAVPYVETGSQWSIGWLSVWFTLVCCHLPDLYTSVSTYCLMVSICSQNWSEKWIEEFDSQVKGLAFCFKQKQTAWPLVRERTIPTERPPLVDEI